MQGEEVGLAARKRNPFESYLDLNNMADTVKSVAQLACASFWFSGSSEDAHLIRSTLRALIRAKRSASPH